MIKQNKERFFYIIVLLILCMISFALGFYIFKTTQKQATNSLPQSQSLVINTQRISPQDIVITKTFIGYVEAINKVDIKPYISGYISSVIAQAGSFVNQNDLLISINDGEYLAKLNAAKAVSSQAFALLEYDTSYYNRVKNSKPNTFSEIQRIEAKNNYLQSKANYENAQAEEAFALFNYNQTIIKAPISGKIGNFTLSVGDYITPSDSNLLTIIQLDPIRVVFSLTDTEYLNLLKEDSTLFKNSVIKLKLANGENFNNIGEFKYTDNKINKNTNSLAVYAYFKNEQNKLLPDAFVTVDVHTTFKDTVSINKKYVQLETTGYFAHINRDNKIEKIKLKLIAEQDNKYVVQNNFEKNDDLIIQDIGRINKNEKIKFQIVK